MKAVLVPAVAGIAALVFAFVVVPRVNRRFFTARYKTGNERMWVEHPSWFFIAVGVGLLVAVVAGHS